VQRVLKGGYPNVTPLYGGLLERRGSKLRLLKSTFNAKNFVLQVVLVYLQSFGATHGWNMRRSLKSRKLLKPYIFTVQGCSRSSICWYPRKARQHCLLW